MYISRREFMQAFGMAIGGLILAGCRFGKMEPISPSSTPTAEITVVEITTCYIINTVEITEVVTTPNKVSIRTATPDPSYTRVLMVFDHPAWDQMRQCWLDLRTQNPATSVSQQKSDHRTQLNELLKAGKVKAQVADLLQIAFEEAVSYYSIPTATGLPGTPFSSPTPSDEITATPHPHPLPTPTPSTCYTSEQVINSRDDLIWRLKMLDKMVSQVEINPGTLTQIRIGLIRDLAFFEAVATLETLGVIEHRLQEDELVIQLNTGRLKVTPEALEAAQVLTELLIAPVK